MVNILVLILSGLSDKKEIQEPNLSTEEAKERELDVNKTSQKKIGIDR